MWWWDSLASRPHILRLHPSHRSSHYHTTQCSSFLTPCYGWCANHSWLDISLVCIVMWANVIKIGQWGQTRMVTVKTTLFWDSSWIKVWQGFWPRSEACCDEDLVLTSFLATLVISLDPLRGGVSRDDYLPYVSWRSSPVWTCLHVMQSWHDLCRSPLSWCRDNSDEPFVNA